MSVFSIVFPIYNTAEYLSESLDSILDQTFRDFTLYAVDDGSQDNSLEILKEYQRKDPRICLISQKNQGVSAARNTALKAIEQRDPTTQYVLFIDSDDKVDSSCLESCYKEIGDADLLVFSYGLFTRDKEKWESDHTPPRKQELTNSQICCHYFKLNEWSKGDSATSYTLFNKCFRYPTIRNQRFCTEIKTAEDIDFFIRVLPSFEKAKLIPDMLYYYRQRESSLSHCEHSNAFDDTLLVYKNAIEDSNLLPVIRIGVQHNLIRLIWVNIHKVMTSQQTLQQKKRQFTKLVSNLNISFRAPFAQKDERRLKIMKMGFWMNFVFFSLKKSKSKKKREEFDK